MTERGFLERVFSPARCWLILGLLLLLTPVAIFGAFEAMKTSSNRVQDWLPEDFEETRQLEWYVERFGSGEILVIAWDGCELGDPRIDQLAEALRKAHAPDSDTPLFREVFTARGVAQQLHAPPIEVPETRLPERLQGWLLGPNGKTTGVLALAARTGSTDRHALINAAYAAVESSTGLSRDEVHLGGTLVDSVAIDHAAKEGMLGLNVAAFGLCLVLLFVCFRSWRIAVLIFQAAILAELISLANLYFTGTHMDSVSLLMASVVYVLSISAAVHLANYYREAVVHGGVEGAAFRAVRDALLPCFLATFTTMIGLGSLAESQVTPIAKFGLFSGVAMLMAFGIVFLLLPASLRLLPVANEEFLAGGRYELHVARWRPLLEIIRRYHVAILVVTLVALALTGWGLSGMRTTVRLHDMFPDNAKIIRDYRAIESTVGPLVPLEVVLKIPKDHDLPLLHRLDVVQEAAEAFNQADGVGAVITAATFLPVIPDRDAPGSGPRIRRTVLREMLDDYEDEIRETGYLQDENDVELWRMSVRVEAERDIDYEHLLHDLEERAEPILREAEQRGLPPITAIYSGGIPLVQKAQRQLLSDLITSFFTAFALVALTMTAVFWTSNFAIGGFNLPGFLRGIGAGALVMIPNILPTVLVFGIMGWRGLDIQMGTMMTASVALGVAVDDTLHFVTWFQRGLREGRSRVDSVMYAYQRCGLAMIQTSAICGFGLLVFAASPFVPISGFSYLMFVLLAASLLGDLIVLPAILIGPLGKVFEERRQDKHEAHASAS